MWRSLEESPPCFNLERATLKMQNDCFVATSSATDKLSLISLSVGQLAPLTRAGEFNPISYARSEAQASSPSQRPLDATIITLEAADVLADVLLEEGLPGHKLKAEPVVDHGEASADEAGDASEATTDILASVCWHVG